MTSVASQNPFDLLEDDAEEVDIIVEGNRQETTSTSTTTEPPVIKPKVDRSRASRTEARIRHEYPQRGGFKNAPSPRNNNNINNNNDTRNEEPRSAPRDRNVGPRLAGRRDREEGGNEFPSRTSRGARAGELVLEESYDSEKKESQGWGNATNPYAEGGAESEVWNANEQDNTQKSGERGWSDNAKDEQTNATGGEDNAGGGSEWNTETPAEGGTWAANDETGEATTQNWNVDKETNQENSGAITGDLSEAPPAAEEVVKTLDEYLAEKKQKASSIALPEIRKPNEGIDDPKWKDAVPLQKEEEDDFLFVGKEQSIKLKSKKSLKTKNFLDIDQTFVEKPGGGCHDSATTDTDTHDRDDYKVYNLPNSYSTNPDFSYPAELQ
ncbi:6084_t:CDS:2 [Ambispora leptoticha]|uniref:6084_t:CDS:1 n=1 Tax=Ambispora leptoticha TaxID=144679 RepID=A0A9N8V9X3_9GLOM|nr:6084_t:CDS:2 [Ambispora leptoticha]